MRERPYESHVYTLRHATIHYTTLFFPFLSLSLSLSLRLLTPGRGSISIDLSIYLSGFAVLAGR